MPEMEEPFEKDDRSPSLPCQEPKTALPIVSPVTEAEVIKPQSIFGDFQDLDNPSPMKSRGSQSSPQKDPQATSPNTQSPIVSKEFSDLEIASPRLSNSDDENDQPVVNSPTSPALIDCGEKTFNDEEEEMQEDEKYEDNSSDDGADKQSEDEVDDSEEKAGRWTASKGAARKKGSKTKPGTEKGETTESAKFEIHSETQRLLREHTFVLLQYKPKQYSSFAEFRSHLHSEDSNAPNPPLPPTNPLPTSLKPTIPGSNHHDEAEEAPEGANEGVEPSDSGATIAGSTSEPVTSTDATSLEEQKHFKLPEDLPPLNLLKANENDIIDLGNETVESTTKEETGLLRLMSRFTQQTRPPEEAPAPLPKKPEAFSIIEKVNDDKTGEAKLVLDTVTYQPSADNAATTTMNRRQWKMHRRTLREIMRSKRLKGYEERMKGYQPPAEDKETEQADADEDDEWSAADEDADSSSSDGSDEDTDEEEDDDEAEEEDDSDSVHGASRTKRDHHPLIDDEAEEDGDEDEDGFDADDDSGTETAHSKVDVKTPSKEVSALSYPSPQLEEPDDFTDLPNEAPPVHHFNVPVAGSAASRFIPQRKCIEPGDVDLFASESTILPEKTFNISRALSSTRFEADPAQDSSMTIRSERSLWNDTPGSLLFSQKQPSICPGGTLTSTTMLLSEPDDGDVTFPADTQETVLLTTQTQVPVDSTLQLAEDTQKLDEVESTTLQNDNPTKPSLMRAYKPNHQPNEDIVNDSSPVADAPDVSPGKDEALSKLPLDSTKPLELGSTSNLEKRRRLRIGGDEDDDDDLNVSREDAATKLTKPRPQSPPLQEKKILPLIKKEPSEAKAGVKSPLKAALDFISTFEQGEDPDEDEEEVEDEGTDGELEEEPKESDYATSESDEKEGEVQDLSGSDLEEAYLLDKASRPEKKRLTKFDPQAFLEEEAELSGDEVERAQFADEDDTDSDAGSLKDFVDEAEEDAAGKLRRQVERIHMRMQEDEDQREVRYLKELFLEDGELFDEKGKVRERRFRWRGLENADPLLDNQVDMDATDDEEEEDADDVASRWLSGGAGVMSRWLLHGAAPVDASEAVDCQAAKPEEGKPTAEKEASVLASPPDRPGNLVLNLGKQALIHRSSQRDIQKTLNFPLSSVPGKLSQKLDSEKMAEQPALKKCSSTSCVTSPPSLQRIRRGSFLLRSTSLFASASGSLAQPSVLSRTEVDTSDEQQLLLPDDTRPKAPSCVLGLQSKVGLSCFSVKRAGGEDAAAAMLPTTNRFCLHPPSSASQPAPATVFSQEIRKRVSTESVQNSVKKSRVSSIFSALL